MNCATSGTSSAVAGLMLRELMPRRAMLRPALREPAMRRAQAGRSLRVGPRTDSGRWRSIARADRLRKAARSARAGWTRPRMEVGWHDVDRHAAVHEPPGAGNLAVFAPARTQSRGLVSLGRGGVRPRPRRGQTDLSLDRLLDLPLVPRDGARVVREPRDRGAAERALRQHQGGSRGAAGRGPRLHDLR